MTSRLMILIALDHSITYRNRSVWFMHRIVGSDGHKLFIFS